MGNLNSYQLYINFLKALDKNVPIDQQIESQDISYVLYMTGFGVAQHISNMHLMLFGVKYVQSIYVPEMKRIILEYNERIDESIRLRLNSKAK